MTEIIGKIFEKNGINQVGFCDFSLVKNHLLPCAAARRIPENAKTVIVCLFPYKVKETPPKLLSRYAAIPDYHGICGNILQSVCEELKTEFTDFSFEFFIDNSPLPEVETAVSAGLGVRGKNGLLINKKYGSFVFIGAIVTDMKIPCKLAKKKDCINCGKCISACPVGCDKTRCLSDLSQKKGELSPEQSALLRENKILWGCDICAEICPMNKGKSLTEIKEFIEGYRDTYDENEDPTHRPYNWRGEKPIKRNYQNLSSASTGIREIDI